MPAGRFDQLPRVTVQLPMYNEDLVAERIIKAACKIDYPREKLEIQVLDDSTDHSADIARKRLRGDGRPSVSRSPTCTARTAPATRRVPCPKG